MAVAFRIDDYTQHPDGSIEIRYTAGVEPLPLIWSGHSWIFSSKNDLQEFLNEGTAEWFTPELAFHFVVAIWKQAQPSMNNPNVVLGKKLVFDPGSITTTMRVI